MKAMDPTDTGDVSYEMFRNWMLDIDAHWADFLVLPEGIVRAIRTGPSTPSLRTPPPLCSIPDA